MSESSSIPKLDLCGIPFTAGPPNAVLEEIAENIAGERTNQVISITNTESMYFALRRPRHAEYIRQSRFSLCDGMGVVIAGRAHGRRIPRFNGPVLMEQCCAHGLSRGWRHFFYGGGPGVASLLSQKLQQRFPGLIVAGVHSPPFRIGPFQEDDSVLDAMQRARPDIVWVGLGLLKQESWIATNSARLQVPWFVGVGAAFDFHAGTARWAPRWIQHIGAEWLYRLCFEPRMFSRNVRSFVFLKQALCQRASGLRDH